MKVSLISKLVGRFQIWRVKEAERLAFASLVISLWSSSPAHTRRPAQPPPSRSPPPPAAAAYHQSNGRRGRHHPGSATAVMPSLVSLCLRTPRPCRATRRLWVEESPSRIVPAAKRPICSARRPPAHLPSPTEFTRTMRATCSPVSQHLSAHSLGFFPQCCQHCLAKIQSCDMIILLALVIRVQGLIYIQMCIPFLFLTHRYQFSCSVMRRFTARNAATSCSAAMSRLSCSNK